MSEPTPPLAPGRLPLEHLLRDEDYGFRLRFAKTEPAAFFGPWTDSESALPERQRWLTQAPRHHAPYLPEAAPLVEELAELTPHWLGLVPPLPTANPNHPAPPPSTPPPDARRWIELASAFEPDLVLLERTSRGPRMVAGAVCLPSSWCPEEKIGQPLHAIHQPVPNLNHDLGDSIDAFLLRLRPGTAWLRANWGLTASPELNQHPSRGLPRLSAHSRLEGTWLRLEHQALAALPRTQGWVFGIRVEQLPLSTLIRSRPVAEALGRALNSMPEPMARYKGIADARAELASQIRAALDEAGNQA